MFYGNVDLSWQLQLLKQVVFKKLMTFIAPKILGGVNSMNPFADFEFKDMNEVLNLKSPEISFIGNDIFVKSAFN